MSIKTITPEQFNGLRAVSSLELIDVRTPAEFEQVHAEGATPLPLDQLDAAKFVSSRSSPQEAIYVICKSGGRSARACASLADAGLETVFNVVGGTDAWVRAGLPVVRGARKTLGLERQVRMATGLLVQLGVALGVTVHPGFLGLSAFVGAGLIFAGVTDFCCLGMLLAKMPWNR